MLNELILKTKIIFYNQRGQGVGFYKNKPVYLSHTIKDEEVTFEILETKKNYFIGKVLNILVASPERVYDLPLNYQKIGGYELMHMSQKAEEDFKREKIFNDFKKNAQFTLKEFEFFNGKKQLRYRNKITLHDGGFLIPKTNEIIYLDDFLLTDIVCKTEKKGKIIFRKLDTLIVGKSQESLYTTDTMLGIKFRVNLNSFYQINKEVAEIIYQDIQNWISNKDVVLDLYSGIATITLVAAQKALSVIGVEKNKHSFKDGVYNIKSNNFQNVLFFNQDAEKFLCNYKFLKKIDTVIVDPSRDGLTNRVIENLLNLEPNRIFYLSCNPGTQAADFKKMQSKYQIIFSKAYNLFPKTYHVENLLILERKNKN